MKKVLPIALAVVLMLFTQSCKKDGLIESFNTSEFPDKLSELNIFQGEMKNLDPTNDYVNYQLGSSLFSDFSYKQRLIKLPPGTVMQHEDDLLPIFPVGTIIAKTFYYFADERDENLGKKVIETRILIKESDKWNVANYKWNDDQTEAYNIESGFDTEVNFINESGEAKVISYHIPNTRECATCHNVSNEIFPIGPKLRNLNIDILNGGTTINQLDYFQSIGVLSIDSNLQIASTPDYHNTNTPVADRAYGYLDINCAHCHSAKGVATVSGLYLDYESLLNFSDKEQGGEIVNLMTLGWMPRIGVSVLDENGIQIIKDYVDEL